MTLAEIMPWLVLAVFNIPVVALLARLPFVADLGQALREKGPIGGPTDTTSYSRITGLIGAVIVTAFYWAIGNIALYDAFVDTKAISAVISATAPLFLVGSALFLPYAFNQIKAAFSASAAAAAAVNAAPPAPVPGTTSPGAVLMNLVIANVSTKIGDAEFAAKVAAVGVQVARDFQPVWGTGATLHAKRVDLSGAPANVAGAADAIVYVGDRSDDPTLGIGSVYGYHWTTHGDLPYAFVYLDVCAANKEAWSAVLSHEVLELLADPGAGASIDGPAPGAPGKTVSYDLEVCDPTQGDTYPIGDVAVSNFVTKAYFGMANAGTATNFRDLPLAPFGVRPGGYVQYEDSGGPQTINGAKVSPARLKARAMMGPHRRNARRAAAFKNWV